MSHEALGSIPAPLRDASRGSSRGRRAATKDGTPDLAGHFSLQGERPAHLRDIDVSALDPALRSLLLTDGTMIVALEAHTLSRALVEVVGQSPRPASASVARCLEIDGGSECVQRRVAISVGASGTTVAWAESHLVAEHLPTGFLGSLDNAPGGIGEAAQHLRLESRRELLWFGLDSPPDWAGVLPRGWSTVLKRQYRVIVASRPALLIAESFAIDQCRGEYGLIGRGADSDRTRRRPHGAAY